MAYPIYITPTKLSRTNPLYENDKKNNNKKNNSSEIAQQIKTYIKINKIYDGKTGLERLQKNMEDLI